MEGAVGGKEEDKEEDVVQVLWEEATEPEPGLPPPPPVPRERGWPIRREGQLSGEELDSRLKQLLLRKKWMQPSTYTTFRQENKPEPRNTPPSSEDH